MPVDPELEPRIRERFTSSHFAKWMGISLVGFGDGRSELRLDLEPHHLNPGGIVHGGVLATLLDASIGLALRSKIGMTTDHVTIELDVHYLSPARTGYLIGKGSAVRAGGRVSYGEAEVFSDEGRLLAKGSATFLVVQARRPGSIPLGGDA